MRPTSLAEVAQLTMNGNPFDPCLANFLDEFYGGPSAAALKVEPALLAPHFGELGHVQDAYLAATVEELARRFGFSYPAWADTESRKLHRPCFASQLAGMRAVLLLESPPGFRSRNIFVSENALARG